MSYKLGRNYPIFGYFVILIISLFNIMCTNKCNITDKLRLCPTCSGKYCFKPGLVDFVEEFPQHFLNYFSKGHLGPVYKEVG